MNSKAIWWLICLMVFLAACKGNDPEVQYVTEYVHDTITITQVDTVLVYNDTLVIEEIDTVLQTLTDTIFQTVTDTFYVVAGGQITTIICLRHAERANQTNDPDLSKEGLARAERLKDILHNIPLDAVYSTDYKRTQQTAAPTALDQGLEVISYLPADMALVLEDFFAAHLGGKVLVVGHGETTPELLNAALGTQVYEDIDEEDFSNLYILSVREPGWSTVTHLFY